MVGRLEFGLTAQTRLSGSLGLWLLLCSGSGVDTAVLVVGSFGNCRCALLLLWVCLFPFLFLVGVRAGALVVAAVTVQGVVPLAHNFVLPLTVC